eukprot:TRINITY_DN60165_c0_g1_i1.p1 TRINITY_DN60165_c0_g1~~TRINITY_DN60165_c0_g1_i1.p1  ORF type:complete len:410 (+),score=41.12 TRINITY_DN60165_c0_g1_i1:50-1279(+)
MGNKGGKGVDKVREFAFAGAAEARRGRGLPRWKRPEGSVEMRGRIEDFLSGKDAKDEPVAAKRNLLAKFEEELARRRGEGPDPELQIAREDQDEDIDLDTLHRSLLHRDAGGDPSDRLAAMRKRLEKEVTPTSKYQIVMELIKKRRIAEGGVADGANPYQSKLLAQAQQPLSTQFQTAGSRIPDFQKTTMADLATLNVLQPKGRNYQYKDEKVSSVGELSPEYTFARTAGKTDQPDRLTIKEWIALLKEFCDGRTDYYSVKQAHPQIPPMAIYNIVRFCGAPKGAQLAPPPKDEMPNTDWEHLGLKIGTAAEDIQATWATPPPILPPRSAIVRLQAKYKPPPMKTFGKRAPRGWNSQAPKEPKDFEWKEKPAPSNIAWRPPTSREFFGSSRGSGDKEGVKPRPGFKKTQ